MPTKTISISGILGSSETLFQDLVEKSGLGIFIDLLDQQIVFCNETFARMFGYTPDEIRTKTFEFFVHSDDIKSGRNHHRSRVKDKNYTGSYEVRGIRKDGSIIFLEIDTSMIVDGNEIIGARSYVRDITRRKQDQEKIRRASKEWEMTFNMVPDIIAVLDIDQRLIRINKALKEKLKKKQDELIGRMYHEIIYVQNKVPTSCPIRKTQNDGKTHSIEIFIESFNGHYKLTSSPLKNNMGVLIGSVLAAHDITEQILASNSLKKSKRELEEHVRQGTNELAITNDELKKEQEALAHKNIALSEVLGQIEAEKNREKNNLASNIDKIIMPLIRNLDSQLDPSQKAISEILKNSLMDITNPLVRNLEISFSKLSPRELQICNMIRNGMTSKEIASILNTSEGTVRFQRKSIRKKLGIKKRNINLVSYLKKNYRQSSTSEIIE